MLRRRCPPAPSTTGSGRTTCATGRDVGPVVELMGECASGALEEVHVSDAITGYNNNYILPENLAPGEVIVAATGVSNGDLLRGVRFLADSARTHSLVMCTRCNWVRFVDGIHFFARERREEVRLLS